LVKKRIIFSLLYNDGSFCLSRNFRLQSVGDIKWLLETYNFENIANSIDELVILNVGKGNVNDRKFLNTVEDLSKSIFVPISIGGGITTINHAETLFKSGADKITLNTLYRENVTLAKALAREFGSQAIIGSVDFQREVIQPVVSYTTLTNHGQRAWLPLADHIKVLLENQCGELLLRSIEKDGTGMGLDLQVLEYLGSELDVPVILEGGVGNGTHIVEGFASPLVDAVCTANLLNFVGDGLIRAREYVEKSYFDSVPNHN
jgi:cyclase